MNTIKKLSLALLVASATQVFASNPLEEDTPGSAPATETASYQEAFEAGKAAAARDAAVQMENQKYFYTQLLEIYRPVLEARKVETTAHLQGLLKTALEEALHEPYQSEVAVGILTGVDEDAATAELAKLMSDDAVTKNDSSRIRLRDAYVAFLFSLQLGVVHRS